MYCTFCGKQITDDAVFCRYCGKPAPQGDGLAKLVAAARSGGQDAVSALYEKTYSKVYYTVKSMIKDEDAVFDIVQDTYIKAFAHLDSFQGDMKFLPWVRKIAANTARDWLKKKRPMLFAELRLGDEQDTPPEELFPDERSENLPDQVIDQKETKRLIREIIEELPEDQRAAIGMFYYEEMSVKEIAAAMGVSESAVKSRLMYGRKKIEKKIRELEKQGTKLYSLSPIPFLLLLFRNQNVYAAEAPDSRILHAVLASQSMGAGTAGAAASTEAAGVAAAGTAAGTGGLGALKIGLIALAAVSAVGLGAFGASRLDLKSGPVANTESEWHESETGDMSAPDSRTASASTEAAPTEPAASSTLPADGDRIVLSGTVGTYDYDGIIALQGQPDPNAEYYSEDSLEYVRSITYRVIVLDTPQILYLHQSGLEEGAKPGHEALMISIDYADGMDQYEGQHIIFSIDPADAYWPSDTSLPLGQPIASDIHILG